MTKAELIAAIVEQAGPERAQAKDALEAFVDSVTDSLRRARRCGWSGFGSFTAGRPRRRHGAQSAHRRQGEAPGLEDRPLPHRRGAEERVELSAIR